MSVTGVPASCCSFCPVRCVAVPMEEIVRAFNFVIDQGWVRDSIHLKFFGSRRAASRTTFPNPHGGQSSRLLRSREQYYHNHIATTHMHALLCAHRRSIGRRLNGLRTKSKKPTVRMPLISLRLLRLTVPSTCLLELGLPDVASKLGLIAPIAEQCQHKCVHRPPGAFPGRPRSI